MTGYMVKTLGTSFASRKSGHELAERLLAIQQNSEVVSDWTGVIVISHSFADEFLTSMTLKVRKVMLVNLAPGVSEVFMAVSARRNQQVLGQTTDSPKKQSGDRKSLTLALAG